MFLTKSFARMEWVCLFRLGLQALLDEEDLIEETDTMI